MVSRIIKTKAAEINMAEYLINPIKAFEEIKEHYILYLKTAFGTRFKSDDPSIDSFEKEREALLNVDRVFYREPWIEPLPSYKTNGTHIKDLTNIQLPRMSNEQIKMFKEFVRKGLIDYDDKPFFEGIYSHQENMLKKALEGNNCVITSGTGSGKTESFLLPLLAEIIKEIPSWQKPNRPTPIVHSWWKSTNEGGLSEAQILKGVNNDNVPVSQGATNYILNEDIKQRAHETRPSAVRALILYPMNALVEDQMTRLRQALDCDDVQEFFDNEAQGNRIYFGRYNSTTPIPGKLTKEAYDKIERNTSKIVKLKGDLRDIEDNMDMVDKYLAANPDATAKEVKSFFQRLYGMDIHGKKRNSSEMRSRFDMQATPPDILITNYSMLSIMMMRNVDSPIFEKTRQWLWGQDLETISRNLSEQELQIEIDNRVFHLVIDELHLYRGTSGTEIAYLMRLLLKRLGLNPNSKKLRILASSASLSDEGDEKEKSNKFLKDFFGITEPERELIIIKGENDEILGEYSSVLPTEPFLRLKDIYDNNPLAFENGEVEAETICGEIAKEIATFCKGSLSGNDGFERLLNALDSKVLCLNKRVLDAFKFGDEIRAISLSHKDNDNDQLGKYFAEYIFGNHKESRAAAEGLIIARGLYDIFGKKTKLPRFRFHFFFRNIEGLWATIDEPKPGKPIGRLHQNSKIVDEESGNKRVLEVLYCESCGTVFYGGKRLKRNQHRGGAYIEMLSNSPKIEGLPEQSVQVLVEKRNYNEYAIFWPIGDDSDLQKLDKSLVPSPGNKVENPNHAAFGNTNSTNGTPWTWREASLNMYTGDVKLEFGQEADGLPNNWVNGYIFCVDGLDRDEELAKKFYALPCNCPHCSSDKFWAKKRKSPIRGFRTGFGKTSQIFAKELFYQLPKGEGKRKLVTFSDSREDAASISNGIERNHYSDLLRDEILNLGRDFLVKSEILTLYEADSPDYDSLKAKHPLLAEDIGYLIDDAKPTRRPAIRDYAEVELNNIRKRIIPFLNIVGDNLITSPVAKKLFSLGVNPAGNNWEMQSFKNSSGQYQQWFKCFTEYGDWENSAPTKFKDEASLQIRKNLAGLLFGKLYYGFESSAFGYTTLNYKEEWITESLRRGAVDDRISKTVFQQLCDSFIRILGENYRRDLTDYDVPEHSYAAERKNSRLCKYVKKAAELYGVRYPNNLGMAIELCLNEAGHAGLKLSTDKLYLKFSSEDDEIYRCNKCKRIHLHPSAGVCTFCFAIIGDGFPKDANCNVREVWKDNYLALNLLRNRETIKIHCEELTGQTDDQFERQRHFRDVIFEKEEGPKNIKGIEILSVTTTLEVGVDIGSLQAVMLANMPPQRFNYQQRVGRGGRRGQAYSVILTLCRGRSHDEYYFANPHKITGDKPPTPFLSIGQEDILKRLLVKELLHDAFSDIHYMDGGTHGEFGKRANWGAARKHIVDFIDLNEIRIKNIISALTDRDGEMEFDYFKWIKESLVKDIDTAVANNDLSAIELSECLAEAGILPMFGMPSRVRVLYSGTSFNLRTREINRELNQVDRPLDMAITEFMPGAQKTKDKKIITSIGFTPGPLEFRIGYNRDNPTRFDAYNTDPFTLRRLLATCSNCRFFKTYNVTENVVNQLQCPQCYVPGTYNVIEIRTPQAFRTDFSPGENKDDDSEMNIIRPSIFAESINEGELDPIEINAKMSLAKKDFTWRINEKVILGRFCTVSNTFPFNPGDFPAYNQWISEDYILRNEKDNNGYIFSKKSQREIESIKLAANKVTNVFRLQPDIIPDGLNLYPFEDWRINPSTLGIRAAYFSAAFILQRALADKLDVDPTEVEIADIISSMSENGKHTAQIVLSDELPNGSGFVKDLYENFYKGYNYLEKILDPVPDTYFGRIVDPEHRTKCKDACYECLKVYRNMPYHGLLDWRLGMGLLRLIKDSNYKSGVDGLFNSKELEDWRLIATELRDKFAESFFKDVVYITGSVPGFISNKTAYLIVHPFWDTNIHKNELLAEVFVNSKADKCKLIDSFNLLRRPGWCYENI